MKELAHRIIKLHGKRAINPRSLQVFIFTNISKPKFLQLQVPGSHITKGLANAYG